MSLFDRIIAARGFDSKSKASFLLPDYSLNYNPFLLPDMDKAVDRLVIARKKQQQITIYGDYDIDGLTSTAVLMDAFAGFGFKKVDVFVPNRFTDGYGITDEAIDKIAAGGTKLIVTVDCGSLNKKEIIKANELGVDVIVTDHHNVAETQPPAAAVVNPKRADSKYPFVDLAGVGVAFKLVQALQTKLDGIPKGQEKWLLDLVALGTVCDVVPLLDENRIFVYWGLKVLSKVKRPGLKALMLVAGINPNVINARALGFGLGPRMNAAGRLETARQALDLLTTHDSIDALEKAQQLDELNKSRRIEQSKIIKEAVVQAEKYINDLVLVVSGPGWNHGIIGIVAAKLLEKYKRPTFVLEEMGDESKGSARSFGDFNVVDAVRYCDDIITKGGGHSFAAGITLPTKNIDGFRKRINKFYESQKLVNQDLLLLPKADADAELNELTEELVVLISQLEPFGVGNPQPILKSNDLTVTNVRKMGSSNQHVKLELSDENGDKMQFLAFGAPEHFFVEIGTKLSIWYHVDVNEWQGNKSVEGKILHLEVIE
jgi:single-stranded-DNA-specific exonuclease